jgi:inorganic pyrophosphatase
MTVIVMIEVPKVSRNKYEYNRKKEGACELSTASELTNHYARIFMVTLLFVISLLH